MLRSILSDNWLTSFLDVSSNSDFFERPKLREHVYEPEFAKSLSAGFFEKTATRN